MGFYYYYYQKSYRDWWNLEKVEIGKEFGFQSLR